MGRIIINGLDIQSIKTLNNEESLDYLRRIKNGDKKAKDEFTIANIKLVLSIVQRYGHGKDIEDMFQIGVVGLLKAIDGFDERFNVKFSTYAVPMILGEIRRLNKDNGGIKVPRYLRDVAYKALNYKHKYEQEKDKTPSVMEIAKEIDIPVKDVAMSLDSLSDMMSLQETIYDDGDDSIMLQDQISDKKETLDNWLDKLILKESIEKLSDKEKSIIHLRYYLGKTQSEISRILNISQAQVSRLESNALLKIRDNF